MGLFFYVLPCSLLWFDHVEKVIMITSNFPTINLNQRSDSNDQVMMPLVDSES